MPLVPEPTITPPAPSNTLITWSWSRTTTMHTRRRIDGGTGVSSHTTVKYVAEFDVVPGALPDWPAQYTRSIIFRPKRAVVSWTDDVLVGVRITGMRVLKNGGVSDVAEHGFSWDGSDRHPVDRDRLPADLVTVINYWEVHGNA
jgi:hypothetical protein